MAPARSDVVLFASTLKRTVPLPVPLAPLVTRIQLRPLTAVHAQDALVVTATSSDAPVAGAKIELGEML
jgi:hypothetical protein